MAEQHRASLGQWQTIKKCNKLSTQSCLLELLHRIEALEAAAQPAQPNHPAKPDSSLVERVAIAITGDGDEPINWKPEARAAIREVAAWLREAHGWEQGAQGLERVAEQ